MIPLDAESLSTDEIAGCLHTRREVVSLWRKRIFGQPLPVHGRYVMDLVNTDMATLQCKKESARRCNASVEHIEKSVALALAGEIDTVVTGPVHKEAPIRPASAPRPHGDPRGPDPHERLRHNAP